MTLLVLIVTGALSISFLCSLLEATLLSARIPELVERRDRGDRGAELLLQLKQQQVDDAISSILILNTFAHTIGAATAGAQAAVVFGDKWVGVFSGVLTLLVLVATEIIPKTLGTSYASRLAGFVARTVRLLMAALAPVLVLTRSLTRLISHSEGSGISRSELAALVSMASRQGALRDQESRLLSNALRLEAIRVADVMTPRTVVAMLPATASVADLLASVETAPFSRIPIFQGTGDEITGYVLQREVLRGVAAGEKTTQRLSDLARPVRSIVASEPLGSVLRLLLEKHEHLAVVTDEFGGAAGIVTLEDLIETVLGVEIVDESDPVIDLRETAKRLREERLNRQRHRLDAQARRDRPDSGSGAEQA